MLRTLCVAAVVILAAGDARAEDVVRKPAGLRITLPEGWKVIDNKKDEGLSIVSADMNVVVFGIELAGLTEEELDAVRDNPLPLIKKFDLLKKPVLDKDSEAEDEVNGLTQTSASGTGRTKEGNTPVGWQFVLVEGAKQPFVLVGFGKLKDNEDELEELTDSIKAVKK